MTERNLTSEQIDPLIVNNMAKNVHCFAFEFLLCCSFWLKLEWSQNPKMPFIAWIPFETHKDACYRTLIATFCKVGVTTCCVELPLHHQVKSPYPVLQSNLWCTLSRTAAAYQCPPFYQLAGEVAVASPTSLRSVGTRHKELGWLLVTAWLSILATT